MAGAEFRFGRMFPRQGIQRARRTNSRPSGPILSTPSTRSRSTITATPLRSGSASRYGSRRGGWIRRISVSPQPDISMRAASCIRRNTAIWSRFSIYTIVLLITRASQMVIGCLSCGSMKNGSHQSKSEVDPWMCLKACYMIEFGLFSGRRRLFDSVPCPRGRASRAPALRAGALADRLRVRGGLRLLPEDARRGSRRPGGVAFPLLVDRTFPEPGLGKAGGRGASRLNALTGFCADPRVGSRSPA